MLQNLAWATGYNVITVPLAAGVLAPVGFVLPPAVGAILMSAVDHRGRRSTPSYCAASPSARTASRRRPARHRSRSPRQRGEALSRPG